MAKINVRVPEPKDEYEVDNQRQINRSLRIIVEQFKLYFFKRFKRRARTIYILHDTG
jgi:hypothetical protein